MIQPSTVACAVGDPTGPYESLRVAACHKDRLISKGRSIRAFPDQGPNLNCADVPVILLQRTR